MCLHECRHLLGLEMNCTPPAIADFPSDMLTVEQRRGGAVAVHVIVSVYLFVALAIVCDKYFVPAVDRICQALNMSADVAGATFMAAATSAPELFINVVGTFITEGDIGIGTIVGSAVFNILAVAACCGIGAGIVVPLDWWPLTRDCVAYGLTVGLLIITIKDERVEWYEALTLVLVYVLYIGVMYFDKSFNRCARFGVKKIAAKGRRKKCKETTAVANGDDVAGVPESRVPLQSVVAESPKADEQNGNVCSKMISNAEANDVSCKNPCNEDEEEESVFDFPRDGSLFKQVWWVLVFPIHLVFFLTIPDCEKPRFKRWFPFTFLMCIVWIGSLSYVVAWAITIVGDTFKIPDSVMGITFLAAGTSVPEAVSSVIVAKQGHGAMGISNSIGSNTFDILLCLGLPWLIKASFLPKDGHFIAINSRGLEYSAISLLSTLLLLYVTFSCNKFRLDRNVGIACLVMYLVFLVLASLIELNVFFLVNSPTCGR